MKSHHTRQNWGLFLLRFGLGVVFVVHGYDKVTNFTRIAGFLGELGFPTPEAFVVLLIIIELIGGIALIIGFYTRIAAVLIVLLMTTTIVLVKGKAGFLGQAELDFALLFSALAATLLGPGQLRLRFASSSDKDNTNGAGKSDGEMSGYQHQI